VKHPLEIYLNKLPENNNAQTAALSTKTFNAELAIPALSSKSPAKFCADHSISAPTFYRLVASGKIQARKIGSRTIVTNAAEQSWLDSLPLAHAPATAQGG